MTRCPKFLHLRQVYQAIALAGHPLAHPPTLFWEVLDLLSRVNDSKQLAEQQREQLFQDCAKLLMKMMKHGIVLGDS